MKSAGRLTLCAWLRMVSSTWIEAAEASEVLICREGMPALPKVPRGLLACPPSMAL